MQLWCCNSSNFPCRGHVPDVDEKFGSPVRLVELGCGSCNLDASFKFEDLAALLAPASQGLDGRAGIVIATSTASHKRGSVSFINNRISQFRKRP